MESKCNKDLILQGLDLSPLYHGTTLFYSAVGKMASLPPQEVFSHPSLKAVPWD